MKALMPITLPSPVTNGGICSTRMCANELLSAPSAASWPVKKESALLSRHARSCTCLGLVPEEYQISQCMDKWKELSSRQIAAVYVRQFPTYWSKLDSNDPVWQPRYYGFNVFTERKLHEKVKYMHNNPVRTGLVKDVCYWPWSSAPFWLQGKKVGIPLSWPP